MAELLDGLPENEYHAHPALSSSGAKRLLPPSCPAIFKWERDHGRPEKRAFDFGHAAHHAVLGVGAPLVIVEAEDWRTKAAREARDAAYAIGSTPILAAEAAVVKAMAEAIRTHPIASALLDPDRGKPEQSILWHDPKHGIDRRARLDWLPDTGSSRLIVTDYKTTPSADPVAIMKAVANFGYHQQAPWYQDAVRAAGLDEDPAFLFIFQEKAAPYLVTVVELDSEALRVGRDRNAAAMDLFAECTAMDTWPAYTDDIELIGLPAWATRWERV